MESDRNGWGKVPALDHWICPNCKKKSPVEDWDEAFVDCEICGEHDARQCPECFNLFDNIYDEWELVEANKPALSIKIKIKIGDKELDAGSGFDTSREVAND